MSKNKKSVVLLDSVYRIADQLILTKRYVKRIREALMGLGALGESQIHELTAQLCMITAGAECLAFYVLFVRRPGLFALAVFCFYAVVIAKEIFRYAVSRTEKKLLRQTEKLLNDVRHFFYDTHSITAALQEAAGIAGYEMRIQIDTFLKILGSEEIESAVEAYNRNSRNRFLKLLLSQCVAIQEYGDTEQNGESVFVRNLSDLREDILNYLMQVERQQLEFAGLNFIVLVPVLALPVIRTTAIETLPELDGFYKGTLGRILPVLFLTITALLYGILNEMQELDARSNKRSLLRWLEKNRYCSALLDDWERRNFGAITQQKKKLRCAGEQITPRMLFLEKLLYSGVTTGIGIIALLWAKGKENSLLWYEAVILMLCSIVAYYIPDVRIQYKKSLMQMNMLSEVTQFQSIIMMQMYIPDITVLRILTMMEQFAYIFRASIQACINEYSYSVQGALQRMKKAEGYEPFRRLCDNLLTVDKIGIVRSFEEIIQDRIHFQRQREADTYRMIKKKADYAKMIAFVPMLLIITSYLILPYGVEAMRQFSMIMEELNGI